MRSITRTDTNQTNPIHEPRARRSIKHYCQNSVTKRLTKFDFGEQGNLVKYGSAEAPLYQVGRLEVQNWVVAVGTYDALADPTTVQRLVETTQTPRPAELIVALGFNHADFLAAVENDKYVNQPLLAQFDKHAEL